MKKIKNLSKVILSVLMLMVFLAFSYAQNWHQIGNNIDASAASGWKSEAGFIAVST